MSERGGDAAVAAAMPSGAGSAGALLRQARQAQGLSLEALAASIKVTPRKLAALEADRLDELPDATFARALAQTVCRSLKLEVAPVLALLPPPSGHRIEQVSEGLNAPFRERPLRSGAEVTIPWEGLLRARVWAPLLLLLAAGLVYLAPSAWLSLPGQAWGQLAQTGGSVVDTVSGWMQRPDKGVAEESSPAEPPPPADDGGATSLANAPVVVAPAVPAPLATLPAGTSAVPAAAAASQALAEVPGLVQLRTQSDSWIEVQDAREKVLFSRILRSGETVNLDGTVPLRVKIGNARATELRYRGETVDLEPMTRDNIARLQLR